MLRFLFLRGLWGLRHSRALLLAAVAQVTHESNAQAQQDTAQDHRPNIHERTSNLSFGAKSEGVQRSC